MAEQVGATPDYGEGELVARLQTNDEAAFAELVRAQGPRMLAVARRLLRSDDDAADAVQEAFISAFRAIGNFEGGAKLSTWLHRIAVNACRDVAQRRLARRCEPLEEDRREARDGDPARAAEAKELRAELGAHLAEISPTQATVVVLKDAFDFTFEEIADAEGMPVGTAQCYAHRGRNGLRELLTA